MNNFRNPYVDPDSFQVKSYDNYRNTTNPHSVHFSVNKQKGVEQKEILQSQRNTQYEKIKKHPIYTNHQKGKVNESKPVMFSPPKIDSIQKPVKEHLIEEFAFDMAQSKNIEDKNMDKNEVVSNLIKEFSLMLDDTPTIHDGFTTLPESEFENGSLLNLSESTPIPENKIGNEYTKDSVYKNGTEEHVYKKNKNSEISFREFHPMLDERNDLLIYDRESIESYNESKDSIEDKFFSMFSESEELQEEKKDSTKTEANIETLDKNTDKLVDKFYSLLLESDDGLQEEKQGSNMNEDDIDALNENTDRLEDKFFKILLESDKLQEEKQVSSFANLKETKDSEMEDLTNGELHLCHKKPSFKMEKKRKYCINKNNSYNIPFLKKINDEWFFQKNIHLVDLVEKKKTTTVKMQVLLSRLETEIDIVETIDLLTPRDNILRVEWSVHSLDCKVILPSKTVFLKGKFIAEIEYGNKELENNLQSLKISIPWSKTANINWLSIPDLPHSNQNEFMFHPQHEHDSSFHFEDYQKFAEPILSQLNQVTFVWYQELYSNEKHLQVNGVAQLSINFMQEQFVELECYSK